MRIFLSGMEQLNLDRWLEVDPDFRFRWTLMSYHLAGKSQEARLQRIIDMSELVLIDSGAHSFQKGGYESVDWERQAHKYGEWIAEHDSDKMVGYFELDIDNVVGYDRVLELREILDQYTDKIIPVWHASRGADDFVEMCRARSGGVVSFSGVADRLTDRQIKWMVKTAWDNGCRIHALGVTRKRTLDTVPFDYVDSTSWVMSTVYGSVEALGGKRDLKRARGQEGLLARMASYEEWARKQEYYYEKWRGVSPVEV